MIQPFLQRLGGFFGLARGSDILVYGSILSLAYLYFEVLHKITKDNFVLTKFVSNEALTHVDSDYIKFKIEKNGEKLRKVEKSGELNNSDFMFHVKGLNEAKTIGKVIDEIFGAGFSKILVVNDGSTDGMDEVVKNKMKEYPDNLIVLLNHLINRKHGGGNKTGIAFFKKFGKLCDIKYIVFFDADDQMDIADMETFMNYISTNPNIDVIQGSRFVDGGEASNMPLSRKIILRGAKLLTFVFNGLAITDAHNGYKCFKLESLIKIQLTTDTTLYANELIDEYKRLGLSVVELPVHIKYSDYSLGKGQKNSNALNLLVEMIYRKLFFR